MTRAEDGTLGRDAVSRRGVVKTLAAGALAGSLRMILVSGRSRRSALSNSTVSYGLPRVCGSITSTKRAAVARSACSISATMETRSPRVGSTGRLAWK